MGKNIVKTERPTDVPKVTANTAATIINTKPALKILSLMAKYKKFWGKYIYIIGKNIPNVASKIDLTIVKRISFPSILRVSKTSPHPIVYHT